MDPCNARRGDRVAFPCRRFTLPTPARHAPSQSPDPCLSYCFPQPLQRSLGATLSSAPVLSWCATMLAARPWTSLCLLAGSWTGAWARSGGLSEDPDIKAISLRTHSLEPVSRMSSAPMQTCPDAAHSRTSTRTCRAAGGILAETRLFGLISTFDWLQTSPRATAGCFRACL